MKKLLMFVVLCSVVSTLCGCTCSCNQEPELEANRSLVVPENFGNMPK